MASATGDFSAVAVVASKVDDKVTQNSQVVNEVEKSGELLSKFAQSKENLATRRNLKAHIDRLLSTQRPFCVDRWYVLAKSEMKMLKNSVWQNSTSCIAHRLHMKTVSTSLEINLGTYRLTYWRVRWRVCRCNDS